MARVPLKGSERSPLAGSRTLGPADPTESVQVSVLLRRRSRQALRDRVARLCRGEKPQHMEREEFARQFGADQADIAAVKAFAASHGLSVIQEHPDRRTVVISGTVAQLESAFRVKLQRFEHPRGDYRGRQGVIELPAELHGVVEAVLGLDNRPQARPHFRIRGGGVSGRGTSGGGTNEGGVSGRGTPGGDASGRTKEGGATAGGTNGGGTSQTRKPSAAAPSSFTPIQLADLYGFPAATGHEQCVGIIELGGGFTQSDLKTYFEGLGVATPKVTAVAVDGGKNAPTGDPNGADGEVMLDIEVVGAIAPQAHVVVYFAPNTDAGFLDAITTAIHDTTNKPSVLSISWGSSESNWTEQSMTAMDDAFQAAATLGVTICAASGDSGSSDGETDGKDHVDFPASSPYALACGGTSLKAGSISISSEVVWNDGSQGGSGGGGISSFFAVPNWQSGLVSTNAEGTTTPLSKRGVPDVSGDADPDTGYNVRIDGTDTVIGGTSAVAPLWSGLLARINQLTGKPVGYLHPQLYKNPQALRDITAGNNGGFYASEGWDACTGLGSPDGQKVSDIFTTESDN